MLIEERMSKVETDVHDIQTEMSTWHIQLGTLTDRVDDIASSLKSIVDVFKRIEEIAHSFFEFLKKSLVWIFGIIGGGLAAALGTYLISHFLGK